MSNVRDKMMAGSIAWRELFTPEFMKSLSSKADAKGIEASIKNFKDELLKIQKDIEEGLSEEFHNDSVKLIDELSGQKKKEENIGQKDTYFMLQEEKRAKEILEAFSHLEKFMHEKKIKSRDILDAAEELRGFIYGIFKLGDKEEKMAWNDAHDHEAFARFLHLRSIHSVANHLKVIEKHVKKAKNLEQKDVAAILAGVKHMEDSKSLKEFEDLCDKLKKNVHSFVDHGLREFKQLEEANEQILILMNNTKESFKKISAFLVEAESKGYEHEDALKLMQKAKEEYDQFHEFSRLMLNWFKSVEHKAEDLKHAADDNVSYIRREAA